MQNRKAQIKAMVERMRQAYGVEKSQLPNIFGCQAKTINNWVYYERIPHEQLEQCREATGKTMDWLMYGADSNTSLSPQQEEDLTLLIHRVIEYAVDYKAIAECQSGGIQNVTEKMCQEIFRYLNPPKQTNPLGKKAKSRPN